ncbi:MAG: hypothetical protein JWO06_1559 [Bacteroidota bacterium]|nr:hypothetical protein [Bacteroidota bacterium]
MNIYFKPTLLLFYACILMCQGCKSPNNKNEATPSNNDNIRLFSKTASPADNRIIDLYIHDKLDSILLLSPDTNSKIQNAVFCVAKIELGQSAYVYLPHLNYMIIRDIDGKMVIDYSGIKNIQTLDIYERWTLFKYAFLIDQVPNKQLEYLIEDNGKPCSEHPFIKLEYCLLRSCNDTVFAQTTASNYIKQLKTTYPEWKVLNLSEIELLQDIGDFKNGIRSRKQLINANYRVKENYEAIGNYFIQNLADDDSLKFYALTIHKLFPGQCSRVVVQYYYDIADYNALLREIDTCNTWYLTHRNGQLYKTYYQSGAFLGLGNYTRCIDLYEAYKEEYGINQADEIFNEILQNYFCALLYSGSFEKYYQEIKFYWPHVQLKEKTKEYFLLNKKWKGEDFDRFYGLHFK